MHQPQNFAETAIKPCLPGALRAAFYQQLTLKRRALGRGARSAFYEIHNTKTRRLKRRPCELPNGIKR